MAADAAAPGAARGGAFVAPLQRALLGEPLAFLAAEHARQTVLLAHLERIAQDPNARAARGVAGPLLTWLTEELPLHLADEEQSLYPRLRPHDTAGVLGRLTADHRRDRLMVGKVIEGLRRLAAGRPVQEGFAVAALGFAALHRRHLELEETGLAPLARRCLTAEALAALAAEMAERRAG